MTHVLPPLPTWLHVALWLLVGAAGLRLVWFAAHRWQPRRRPTTPGRHRATAADLAGVRPVQRMRADAEQAATERQAWMRERVRQETGR